MITRKTLFPGEHYIDQTNKIMEICGTPDAETLLNITNEYAIKFLKEIPPKSKIPLSSIIKYSNPLAIDLLEKMLELNPKRRISAKEALKHPYLTEFHDPSVEPMFEGGVDFSFENNPNLTFVDVAKMIFAEMQDIVNKK